MQITFFDSYPHQQLEDTLRTILRSARRVDAAIAFVTRHGVEAFRTFPRLIAGAGAARLVASVRFPTDLRALADLATTVPGDVHVHLGFSAPEEEAGERGQLHSKVVLVEQLGADRIVLIGSHNWTRMALEGHNLEAGVIVRCRESDPIVRAARRHIEACIARSEVFDPPKLRYYQLVQQALHVAPPALADTDSFPGFEQDSALVIHAENGTNGQLPNPVQLYIPLRSKKEQSLVTVDKSVMLYVYPRGALLGGGVPKEAPILLKGVVTMVNRAERDAPVDRRAANTAVDDLMNPILRCLPSRSVPPLTGEGSQAVMAFDNCGRGPLPVFHYGWAPKVVSHVQFGATDRDPPNEPPFPSLHDLDTEVPHDETGERSTELRAPCHGPQGLQGKAELRVPSIDMYPENLRETLEAFLLRATDQELQHRPVVHCVEPDADKMLSRYVYQVSYSLPWTRLCPTERQRTLFDRKT